MAENDDITVTYETLFELLRNEKAKNELQKLPPPFYEDVANYLKEKRDFIEKTKGELFSDETTRNKELELNNIKKIVKDLYDKREKKIITLAIDKSRTKTNLIDTSNFLKEELEFYNKITQILDINRKDILLGIFEGTIIKGFEDKKDNQEKKEYIKPQITQKGLPNEAIKDYETEKEDTKLIRFLDAVPSFVGPELEEYGPFEKDNMAKLPSQVAEILITKGRAEEMKDN